MFDVPNFLNFLFFFFSSIPLKAFRTMLLPTLTSTIRRTLPATLTRSSKAALTSTRSLHSFYSPSLASLTDDQSELLEAVKIFTKAEVEPRANEIDSENKSPMDLWQKMGEMGLLGVTVPEEDGGLGKGYLEHTMVMEGE